MLAPVGSDLPEAAAAAIEEAGFDFGDLPRRDVPTIRNQVHYAPDGSRRWVFESSEEVFHELSVAPSDIPGWALSADGILISAMSLAAQEACIEFLRTASNALLVLDLQEAYIVGNEQRILDLVGKVDVFLPSEEEARRLAKREDWEELVRWFAGLGPRVVAIKFAEKGSLVYGRETNHLFRAPARRTTLVDSTGAGDGYCGGFVAKYLQDPTDLPRAARAASISAAFAVSGYGTEGLLNAQRADARRQLDDPEGWLTTQQERAGALRRRPASGQ
jgi:ribokinase